MSFLEKGNQQTKSISINYIFYQWRHYHYKLTLDLYNKSLDQQGWYFQVGDVALVTDAGIELQNPPVVEIDPQSLEITFNQIIFREFTFSGTFYPYSNPNDDNGIYFQMFPSEFIPNGTIINP
ncbi:MAG: hypothetical protein GQ581_01880 [Methyloprofundus sp.]|nr:hypothetical protein [Methyloprofundus sp.]